MSTTTQIDVPTWDGKRDTFDTYQFKLSAYAAIKKCTDVLNKSKMANGQLYRSTIVMWQVEQMKRFMLRQ